MGLECVYCFYVYLEVCILCMYACVYIYIYMIFISYIASMCVLSVCIFRVCIPHIYTYIYT
jgi:hypothetical protein